MAPGLNKQVVPILLKGIDQGQPRQAAAMGTLQLLQNMVLNKATDGGYEFAPRPGTTNLSKTADVGTISTGMRLGTLGAGLVLLTGTSCYKQANSQWWRVSATAPMVGVDTEAITSNTVVSRFADTAYVNGFKVRASSALDATGGNYSIKASVIDQNGATMFDASLDTGTIGPPRVVLAGNVVVVFWMQSPNLIRAAKFDSTSPTAFGAPISVVVAGTAASFDAQLIPSTGNIAVIWGNGLGALAQRLLTPSSMTLGGITTYGFTLPDTFGYLTNNFSTNTIYLGHVDAVNGLRVTTFDGTTLALGATTVYDAAATQAVHVTGYRAGASVSVYIDVGTGLAYDQQIKVSTGGAVSRVKGSFELASRVMSQGSSLYALARYRGAGQGTYFLLDLTAGVTIGRALPDIATTSAQSNLANLQAITSTSWLTAGIRTTAVATENGTVFTYTAATQILFTFQDATVGRPVELNGGMHIPGAQPYLYDGAVLVEHGFPIAPEQADAPAQSGGGGLTVGATYSYLWVYEWLDYAGNLHRSGPSLVPQSVTMTAANTRLTFQLPTLRDTRKVAVSIAGYRSTDGIVYRKVTSTTAPTINDPAVDRVTFIDGVSDVTAAAGEPLYTGGSVLENIAPPPCRTMAVHRGRLLVGAISGDVDAVWFSKDVEPGFGVAFSDFLVSRITSVEPITALASMDSYAVACTNTQTWGSINEYPDDTGGGGVLVFQQQSDTTGCAGPGLIGRNDLGLMTYGGVNKGIWRASRGLTWDWVGSPVVDSSPTQPPSAILSVQGQSQMRVMVSQSAFVFESIYGQWSIWTYPNTPGAIVDAVMWNGTPTMLCSEGTVVIENTILSGVISDSGAMPQHVITLSGINFFGVAGFGRLYITQITGLPTRGAEGFQLNIDQSFDGVPIATKTEVYTGTETELFVEADPGTMGKCSRYDLSISDSANGLESAFTIVAITALVGSKVGLSKLPPARRAV